MKVIKFEVHLIETEDLHYVREHILEHAPCVAFYKVIYPVGNSAYFTGVAVNGETYSVSTGQPLYDMVPPGYLA